MMTWASLLNAQRLLEAGKFSYQDEQQRSSFHKDQDRIIFSSAFRRLEKKTQVHPFPVNDHAHSRLTHSLEVSCVGRSLGTQVGFALESQLPDHVAPQDIGAIVQAACLAHDIGNPPFGHTGEDAIRQWFSCPSRSSLLIDLSTEELSDLKTFEGNAQGFRVITQHEYHRFSGGMQLTAATLGTFLKYPWSSVHQVKGKYGCYQSEIPLLQALAERLGLIRFEQQRWCRHPLAYLVEAADDICYALLDLEDGVEMGLITYDEVEKLMLTLIDKKDSKSSDFKFTKNNISETQRLCLIRGPVVEVLVNAVTEVFISHQDELLKGSFNGDLISKSRLSVTQGISEAKALAQLKIFLNPQKMTVEIGAYSTLSSLLDIFIGAVDELLSLKDISYRHQRALKMMGSHAPQPNWDRYSAYLRVIDYISGMTDPLAIHLAQHIRGLQR